MRVRRWFAAPLALALLATASAEEKVLENKLPDAVVKALEKADSVELYSLTGERADKEKDKENSWRGWKSLGKATLSKAADKKAVSTAVTKGVAEADGGARCFVPRHGLRATHGGKTYELVICFECSWVYVYTDGGDKPDVFMTANTPQKALDKFLTDAKVKLPKPDKK
ncbi:MAG: hypothetical protein FJ304_11185 [Planctomycetes bacterium]|nr:hypothetical protein [Planctomycetota bacterium]